MYPNWEEVKKIRGMFREIGEIIERLQPDELETRYGKAKRRVIFPFKNLWYDMRPLFQCPLEPKEIAELLTEEERENLKRKANEANEGKEG